MTSFFKYNFNLQTLFLQIQDPLEKALAAKNKGNKYFRGGRYELAIKCYSQAIECCPEGKKSDLSTFYQNRAAAYEQGNLLKGFDIKTFRLKILRDLEECTFCLHEGIFIKFRTQYFITTVFNTNFNE